MPPGRYPHPEPHRPRRPARVGEGGDTRGSPSEYDEEEGDREGEGPGQDPAKAKAAKSASKTAAKATTKTAAKGRARQEEGGREDQEVAVEKIVAAATDTKASDAKKNAKKDGKAEAQPVMGAQAVVSAEEIDPGRERRPLESYFQEIGGTRTLKREEEVVLAKLKKAAIKSPARRALRDPARRSTSWRAGRAARALPYRRER